MLTVYLYIYLLVNMYKLYNYTYAYIFTMICAKLIYEENTIQIDLVAGMRTKRSDDPRHILFFKFFILIFYFISIIQKLLFGIR